MKIDSWDIVLFLIGAILLTYHFCVLIPNDPKDPKDQEKKDEPVKEEMTVRHQYPIPWQY